MVYGLRHCRMYDVEVETHKRKYVTIKAVPLQTYFLCHSCLKVPIISQGS